MKPIELNLLIILFILILIFFIFYKTVIKERYENNYHIIVSKYKKDVSFLDKIGISYTVIDKNTAPNKANEATSYLYYIII